MPIPFVKDFTPDYDNAVVLNDTVRLVTARNPSPFTFTGTNSYIIGSDTLGIIDPGPDNEEHLQNLLRVIGDHPLSHIFITHSHSDHSALAKRLAEKTSAIIVAEGPYRPASKINLSTLATLDASCDTSFKPDIELIDGQIIDGDGWQLKAVTTPGHMANHTAFALEKDGIVFSGDHVMAWSTTVVAPPDGSMGDYMQSLDKLLERDDRVYLSGHGGAIHNPHRLVRAIKAHRKMRERAVLERLNKGDHTIATIAQAIYRNIDPRLRYAAELSVLAHIESLVDRHLVQTDGAVRPDGIYSLS